jgi:putative transposase
MLKHFKRLCSNLRLILWHNILNQILVELGHAIVNSSKRIQDRLVIQDRWYLDEVFIKINSVLHYLWQAVNQNSVEIDI